MRSNQASNSWVDNKLYPFENNYIQLEAGAMHYVDEGTGETLLFVHGTPTWSFLYRDFIKELSKKFRCIAPDHLGFGLSEKPVSNFKTPDWHKNNLSEFIVKMDLRNITLIVHDFGGPIGIAAGIDNPERIKNVVLFNSWLWETENDTKVQKADRIVKNWLGRFLYLSMNFSPKVLLKNGYANKRNLTKTIHRHYITPFPTKDTRQSLLDLALSLKGSSNWYEEQWQKLDVLGNKSWLIIWGSKDQFLSNKYLRKWQGRIPEAKTISFDCGHYVQEERANQSINEIKRFIINQTPANMKVI